MVWVGCLVRMIKKKIKKKLEITIPIIIFLTIVIKEFFLVSQPENASRIFLAFSVIVALYIIIYGLYYFFEKNIKRNRVTIFINYLLTINFIIVGLQIIYILFSVSGKIITNPLLIAVHKILTYSLGILIIIPLLIFASFVLVIPFQGK